MPAPKPTFAHDANLGFQVDDPRWSGFLERYGIDVGPYRDMVKLTRDLRAGAGLVRLSAGRQLLLPSRGVLPTVPSRARSTRPTDPRASPACSWSPRRATSRSSTSFAAESSATRIATARRATSRRRSCSTSTASTSTTCSPIWSRCRRIRARSTRWMSAGVDATMVEEDVWRKDEANARDTRVIGRRDGLPTPLLIVAEEAAETFARRALGARSLTPP